MNINVLKEFKLIFSEKNKFDKHYLSMYLCQLPK